MLSYLYKGNPIQKTNFMCSRWKVQQDETSVSVYLHRFLNKNTEGTQRIGTLITNHNKLLIVTACCIICISYTYMTIIYTTIKQLTYDNSWYLSLYQGSLHMARASLSSVLSWYQAALPYIHIWYIPDSKVHGAKMGPTWGRQDPGGPRVGHMNLAIWDMFGHLSIRLFRLCLA